ncbi:metallophosphoesterase [Nostoc sp. LEGE 12450]|uniref:metallophosphoesterase n=1 Tax=Nostoc sp. LEGE 12450 TaxID=1828643 RepID=UPI001D13EDCB|nr:metallophosphoesterase [Nostoc sp. LEGE 12450]
MLALLPVHPLELGFDDTILKYFDKELYMSNADNQIRILHLSDIHLETSAQAQRYFTQLASDLTQNLHLKQLNYLVISGDITNHSTQEEYEAAFKLVDKLVKRYGLAPNRIIIVPGNHDLNWELSETAYTFVPKGKLPNPLPEGRYIDAGSTGALIRNEDEYKKRFEYFSDCFYKKIYNQPYPQEYDQQAILHPCLEDKILFLACNSCWEIDHEYRNRSSIHPNAIANALLTENYDDWLKIAVWHHPVNSSESMKNVEFLEQLAVNGFQLGIHGHIHQARDENFKYDTERGLRIIAAGTFGALATKQVTGIPLQYNLLTLDPESGMLTVETRKKEKTDGAWSADARWGDKNNPVPRYTIELRYGSKTGNYSSQIRASTPDNRPNPQQSIFRNTQVGGNITVGNITQIYTLSQATNSSENLPPRRTILILASSPENTARLRLDREVREIDEGLRRAQQREQFILQQKWAVRPDDLRRALLDFNPQIAHFCGHGVGQKGLVLDNNAGGMQLVPTNALVSLFKLFANRGLECIVLNACYAEVQAEAISQHINYVVGMSDEIEDNAAIKFAVGFYDALGAGWSYEDAYEMGCSAIALEGISQELIPVLKKRPINNS